MVRTNYVLSYQYENFISMALECGYGKHDFKNSDMENLMDKEDDASWAKHLNRKKTLQQVKKGMTKAITHACKRQLSQGDKKMLRDFLMRVESNDGSSELLVICNEGMDILRKYQRN